MYQRWQAEAKDAATYRIAQTLETRLKDMEQRLDAARFFRVSRAALINLNAVAEVFPMPGGSGEVLLKNGQRLEVSRRRFRDLLQSLEGR